MASPLELSEWKTIAMATSPQAPDLPITLSGVLTYLTPAAQGGEALLDSAKVTGCSTGPWPGSAYLWYLSVDWTVRYSHLAVGTQTSKPLGLPRKGVISFAIQKEMSSPCFYSPLHLPASLTVFHPLLYLSLTFPCSFLSFSWSLVVLLTSPLFPRTRFHTTYPTG